MLGHENIFKKYLLHVVAFSVVDKWIKAAKIMYGDKAARHGSVWYAAVGDFPLGGFTTETNSLDADIALPLSSLPGGSQVRGIW